MDKPKKFRYIFKDDDGTISTWDYDLDINPNGPIEVNVEYPKNFIDPSIENDKLPLTQRKFLNPANGKMVAYGRAKQLKLI